MKTVIAGLTAAVTMVSAAQAQTFANLEPKGVPTVYVTDRSGQETEGKLVSITESLITIRVAERTTATFTPDQVTLIERKGDSLKNGALIGMAVGIFSGALTMGLSDCPSGKHSCAGARTAGFLVTVGLYSAIGAGIDAAIPGRERIWPRSGGHDGWLVMTASPAERRAFIGWKIVR